MKPWGIGEGNELPRDALTMGALLSFTSTQKPTATCCLILIYLFLYYRQYVASVTFVILNNCYFDSVWIDQD